jgi:hypothetical protein
MTTSHVAWVGKQVITKLQFANNFRLSERFQEVFEERGKVITTKLTLSHCTPRRHLGERRYSSYSFSTSALDERE